jgi:hypothetical protein
MKGTWEICHSPYIARAPPITSDPWAKLKTPLAARMRV